MTVRDTIKSYRGKLDLLDIELLIAHSLNKTREFVLSNPDYEIPAFKIQNLKFKISRRMRGEPIAYIVGHKEFYGLDFIVNKHTLVPRPETEQIVDEVLRLNPKNCAIIDIGTGSGNIVISLAKSIETSNNFFAIDISPEALAIARKNAKTHNLNNKIKFIQGNLLSPFLETNILITKKIIITANLPYVDTGWKNLLKSTETNGLKFEPSIALYAGKDGLDAYRKLATQLRKLKKEIDTDITVLCEIGHLQKKEMSTIFKFANKITFYKDLARKWRVCEIVI